MNLATFTVKYKENKYKLTPDLRRELHIILKDHNAINKLIESKYKEHYEIVDITEHSWLFLDINLMVKQKLSNKEEIIIHAKDLINEYLFARKYNITQMFFNKIQCFQLENPLLFLHLKLICFLDYLDLMKFDFDPLSLVRLFFEYEEKKEMI